LDSKRLGQPRVAVYIHFGQGPGSLSAHRKSLEHGAQRSARPTPVGPEVNDHRGLVRALKNVPLERSLPDFENLSHVLP
jgi:hypothetical protein